MAHTKKQASRRHKDLQDEHEVREDDHEERQDDRQDHQDDPEAEQHKHVEHRGGREDGRQVVPPTDRPTNYPRCSAAAALDVR